LVSKYTREHDFLLTSACVHADLVPTEDCSAASSQVSLLQAQHVVTDGKAGEAAEVTFPNQFDSNSKRKVAWFHIPKCGTSFGTTLMHYANSSLPREARIRAGDELPKELKPGQAVLREFPASQWFKNVWWEKSGNVAGHNLVSASNFKEFRGNFFGMFREPWQRMYSDWNFFGKQTDPETWLHKRAGMATKMLAGQQDGLKVSPADGRPNIELALSRLDGFAFVGLTDQWALSICLFHVMFGGEFHPTELENMRPGNYEERTAQKRFF